MDTTRTFSDYITMKKAICWTWICTVNVMTLGYTEGLWIQTYVLMTCKCKGHHTRLDLRVIALTKKLQINSTGCRIIDVTLVNSDSCPNEHRGPCPLLSKVYCRTKLLWRWSTVKWGKNEVATGIRSTVTYWSAAYDLTAENDASVKLIAPDAASILL